LATRSRSAIISAALGVLELAVAREFLQALGHESGCLRDVAPSSRYIGFEERKFRSAECPARGETIQQVVFRCPGEVVGQRGVPL
jgi:hypothetical protein